MSKQSEPTPELDSPLVPTSSTGEKTKELEPSTSDVDAKRQSELMLKGARSELSAQMNLLAEGVQVLLAPPLDSDRIKRELLVQLTAQIVASFDLIQAQEKRCSQLSYPQNWDEEPSS